MSLAATVLILCAFFFIPFAILGLALIDNKRSVRGREIARAAWMRHYLSNACPRQTGTPGLADAAAPSQRARPEALTRLLTRPPPARPQELA